MEEPEIIVSPLSRIVEEDGVRVEIAIFRIEDTDWSLEILAGDGMSTAWDDLFVSDEEALAEALRAIREDGIASFFQDQSEKPTLH